MSLEKFKHSLKNFDDNERARTNYHSSESVMHFKAKGLQGKNKTDNAVRKNVSFWSCGQQGHVKSQCRQNGKLWCSVCKSNTHTTQNCRKAGAGSNGVRVLRDSAPVDQDGGRRAGQPADLSFVFNVSSGCPVFVKIDDSSGFEMLGDGRWRRAF